MNIRRGPWRVKGFSRSVTPIVGKWVRESRAERSARLPVVLTTQQVKQVMVKMTGVAREAALRRWLAVGVERFEAPFRTEFELTEINAA